MKGLNTTDELLFSGTSYMPCTGICYFGRREMEWKCSIFSNNRWKVISLSWKYWCIWIFMYLLTIYWVLMCLNWKSVLQKTPAIRCFGWSMIKMKEELCLLTCFFNLFWTDLFPIFLIIFPENLVILNHHRLQHLHCWTRQTIQKKLWHWIEIKLPVLLQFRLQTVLP